jgi:actin-related protein 5
MSDPYIDRPNMVSRYKEKKFGRQYMLFGKDGDVDAMSRSSQKAMFEGDLLIQADILVSLTNYERERELTMTRKTRWTTRL